MKLKNKKVLVYGMGDSGRAVIKLLHKLNAYVSFYDDDVKFYDQIGFERRPEDVDWDLVVISPGIKCLGNPLLKVFDERKIPVISELDLAYLQSKGKIVAITGTNGKTTVSMLTHRILKMAGFETFLCGNIGLPFSSICQQTNKNSITVCEVSNFQLERSVFFRANVSCILNVRPDHLDRHESFAEYVRVKAKIAQNLRRKDVLILNLNDEQARKLVLHKNFLFFSKNRLKKGVYVWKNQIFVNKKSVLNLSDVNLAGQKNLENVLASVAMASRFGVEKGVYEKAIKSFSPPAHRMEVVGKMNGVTFVDDSKATNVASTVACVEAFGDKPIWLLLGGLGKEIAYDEIFDLKPNIKRVVCFGQEGNNMANCAKKHGCDCAIFDKFDDAVNFCIENAQEGDFVLLSPACASFDEFSSYAERGERFKSLILRRADEN